jgi:AraC-like DNA-binding protein
MFHPHRIEAEAGEHCDYFNITFLPEALSGSGVGVNEMLQPFYRTSDLSPVTLEEPAYRRIASICEAIIEEIVNPDRHSAAIVLGEFRVLLGLVTRSAGSGERTIDPRVQQVLRIITEHFAEPLETRELAERVDTSSSRLAQLFREHTGTTIRAALLRRRLTEAKRLLATTDAPITDVLYESGFNDVSYFNRAFRKDTGRTPREYRRHAR